MLDIDLDEYLQRVNHNTNEFKRQYNRNSFDPSEFHLATSKKKELSIPMLLHNAHDIYASAMLGALAIPSFSGIDAVFLENDTLKHVELKTSYATYSSMWKTPDGQIYTGKQNLRGKKRAITSHFRATFTISKNVQLNNVMDTYLICVDGMNNDIICAYMLDKVTVTKLLSSQKCTKRSIPLTTFMSHGTEIKTTIPSLGYDSWYNKVLEDIPTLKYGEIFNGC